MFERPVAMVKSPGLLLSLSQGTYKESLGAARIKKGFSLWKHCSQKLCGPAKEAAEIAPMISVLPVAFASMFEVVGIKPFPRNRHGRSQILLLSCAVEESSLGSIWTAKELGQTLSGPFSDCLKREFLGEFFGGFFSTSARFLRPRPYRSHMLARVSRVGLRPMH